MPIVTRWLQGTNRTGEPHDHSHNLSARMAITDPDGKPRALDTMRIRGHMGGMSGVVATYVEPAMAITMSAFGVQWVRRADGMGNEIKGVTQEWKDAGRAHVALTSGRPVDGVVTPASASHTPSTNTRTDNGQQIG